MEIQRYPLLCWKIDQKYLCGCLIGTAYQVVAGNRKKITSMLTSQVSRDAAEDYLEPPITNPVLKEITVKVRPAYQEKEGLYPIAAAIEIPVAAVYGANRHGFYECFLPFLQEHFFFYDQSQVIGLIEHFSQNKFKGLAPETLHRFFMPGSPWLDQLILRLKPRKQSFRLETNFETDYPTLSKISERFPYSRQVRRQIKIFPDVAWEQSAIIQSVVEKLFQEGANLLLVGEHGTGKSAILTEAATKIAALSKKENRYCPFWRTSVHRITATAQYLGEWEEICADMVSELRENRGILWLSAFIDLLRMGGEGAEDSVAAFLNSYLHQGDLQIVSEVTPSELNCARNLLPGFVGQFQILSVDSLSPKKLFRVLHRFSNYANENFAVTIAQPSLERCYRLLDRFIKYESFPGKAIFFLSECLNEAYLAKRKEITPEDILRTFIAKTGMAEIFLCDDLLLDKVELRRYFEARIIGQPEALASLATVIKIFKAGLNNPHKPIATMLFAGPTGVGKTATVRALAQYIFGKGQKLDPLIRLDMSEFQYPGQIHRLIGMDGREPGTLLRQVRERPFSVVLLDEIEKAHSSIFDALLTILDEGLLTDAYGRSADFRNTIIIMTSNLGSEVKSIGFTDSELIDFSGAVKTFFRPEFYNRLDMVVTFRPLSYQVMRQITLKELQEINKRHGFRERDIQLRFSDSVVDFLGNNGFDQRYGARPLQRAIERLVVAPLAQLLLREDGICHSTLMLKSEADKLVIERM